MPNHGNQAVMRKPSEQELIHERLGATFGEALSLYDTRRRMEVLIDEFLPGDTLKGKSALDVGTGLGFFAERMISRGAHVTAVDLGPNLIEQVRTRLSCPAFISDALSLTNSFEPDSFDIVLSSECIEHTPDPQAAIRQMLAMLKPGGLLSLSTPNVFWYPLVALATRLKVRPFTGLENFSTFDGIGTTIRTSGGEVLRQKGLHLFPFQFGLRPLSMWLDEHFQFAQRAMINLCVLARKL